MCFKIILKVTEKQGFTLSLEDTVFEKPQVGWGNLRNYLRKIKIFSGFNKQRVFRDASVYKIMN